MPRVKRSITAKKKRRKILKMAKGYFGARARLLRPAPEPVGSPLKLASGA
jgi:large subunit ribosomal protein L20